jgi:saccharopine dehydrogenase-like NADP-dependent oxidoreductase
MKRVFVIGLGMQGQAALHDMARRPEFSQILVADSRDDVEAIMGRYRAEKVAAVRADAADGQSVARLIREADIVVEALPAALALRTGHRF